MTDREQLRRHLAFFRELGVEGVSRDARWRVRDPAAGAGVPADPGSDPATTLPRSEDPAPGPGDAATWPAVPAPAPAAVPAPAPAAVPAPGPVVPAPGPAAVPGPVVPAPGPAAVPGPVVPAPGPAAVPGPVVPASGSAAVPGPGPVVPALGAATVPAPGPAASPRGPAAPPPGAAPPAAASLFPPPAAAPAPPAAPRPPETLDDVRADLGECTRCKLHGGRTNLVFGVGSPTADLVFVGEAPGRDEDRQGIPFVGRAGQLLTRIIAAIGLSRDEVYIANVIKCRPPNNRNPEADEVATCEPFLFRQLDVIRPRVVVALGGFAIRTLLQTDEAVSRLRGRMFDYRGAKLIPTFHPAFLLRSPERKRDVWEDMKRVRALLADPESAP